MIEMMMVGTSSQWIIRGHDGSLLEPAQVEEIAGQVMDALLDIESESDGRIHSATVGATLVEGRISIEFCVNAQSIDDAQKVVTKTLRDILQRRLGHNLRDDSVQETSLSYELVPA
jgi:hypothetical protein